MSDTPRTDDDLWSFPGPMKVAGGIKVYVRSQTARQLERELNAANQRIKQLEEAAQRVDDAAYSIQDWSGTVLGDALDELNKAKEAKP